MKGRKGTTIDIGFKKNQTLHNNHHTQNNLLFLVNAGFVKTPSRLQALRVIVLDSKTLTTPFSQLTADKSIETV